MTREEIIQSNKLIAEFMGYYEDGIYWTDGNHKCGEGGFKYHESWDWLMPVVENIETLRDGCFSFFIVQDECDTAFNSSTDEKGNDWDAPNFKQSKGDKLKSVYACVGQFINWYNTK